MSSRSRSNSQRCPACRRNIAIGTTQCLNRSCPNGLWGKQRAQAVIAKLLDQSSPSPFNPWGRMSPIVAVDYAQFEKRIVAGQARIGNTYPANTTPLLHPTGRLVSVDVESTSLDLRRKWIEEGAVEGLGYFNRARGSKPR